MKIIEEKKLRMVLCIIQIVNKDVKKDFNAKDNVLKLILNYVHIYDFSGVMSLVKMHIGEVCLYIFILNGGLYKSF